MVSVPGIIIDVLMAILIIIVIIIGVSYNGQLKECETKQSTFCHTIQCPCDSTPSSKAQGPCFGYAKQPAGKPGQWYCSNAPLTAVDDSGNPV